MRRTGSVDGELRVGLTVRLPGRPRQVDDQPTTRRQLTELSRAIPLQSRFDVRLCVMDFVFDERLGLAIEGALRCLNRTIGGSIKEVRIGDLLVPAAWLLVERPSSHWARLSEADCCVVDGASDVAGTGVAGIEEQIGGDIGHQASEARMSSCVEVRLS